NLYAASKLEAEKLAVDARARGVVVNIFRAGNLTFQSHNGKFQENIGDNAVYIMMRALIRLGIMPDSQEEVLDFAFIDYSARAINLIMGIGSLANRTFHIHNSNGTSLYKLGEMINLAGFPVRSISYMEYLDSMLENYQDPDLRKYVDNLVLHTHMMDSSEGTEIEVVSEWTDVLLERLDFHWPQLSAEHVKKMLEHCKDVKFL
ncbi:MAG: hypothetical protein GY765_43820, partial [bacterium]|nr:hypothetical protein [bacterium]